MISNHWWKFEKRFLENYRDGLLLILIPLTTENRALQIIRKIEAGQGLAASEMQYEITSIEELQGLLLPIA